MSETRTVKVYVPGACPAVGVHVKTPVVALIVAPAGASTSSEYVNVCAG